MNPRTVCFCQPIWSVISASVAPFFRCSMATTVAVLLPGRASACLAALGGVFAFRAFLALVVVGLAVRPTGAPVTPAARLGMASQIRATALARFSNFLTGFSLSNPGAPANEFQISARRPSGICAAAAARRSWLSKATRQPAAIWSAAAVPRASAFAKTWMLLSVSMVNVVIFGHLAAVLAITGLLCSEANASE